MKFSKKTKISSEIPTASMPDIIFMLLVFFMVTTVLREFSGLPVCLVCYQMGIHNLELCIINPQNI